VSGAPDQPLQETESSRELTLDEALAVAILLQKNEDYAAAHEVYRRVLEAAPNHPSALHYAGLLAHQQGRNEEALGLIERSLALSPDAADWHSNRGIVLQSAEKLGEAIGAYARAIAIDPDHANAHNNLGVLLRARGEPEQAEAAYRTALRLDPAHIDAWTNLGILLNAQKRTQEAAACYSKVITLRPKHRDARKLLAMAHCTLGEVDEAVRIFEDWLAEEPEDPIAQHMLAACTGRSVPGRASDGFVQTTFDGFAASFESKLAKLSYRAPALIAAMLEDCGHEPTHQFAVLDAGCGTGLCGALVAPFARTLTGVDLSEGMLKQAAEKNVYHALINAELTAYLRDHREAFDLIVSADTLVYFGDLADVIAAGARALRLNGLFVFTLEHATGEGDTAYRLERHGRYSHGQAYVERLLTAAGLQPTIAQAELRMEAGIPVAGLVVRATKAAPSAAGPSASV
jgi:predicted TPR repeat methyltransferase